MTAKQTNLNKVLELGEGQFIEFKEPFDKSLAKEIAAFANASGGVIYLGVNDDELVRASGLPTDLNRPYKTLHTIVIPR